MLMPALSLPQTLKFTVTVAIRTVATYRSYSHQSHWLLKESFCQPAGLSEWFNLAEPVTTAQRGIVWVARPPKESSGIHSFSFYWMFLLLFFRMGSQSDYQCLGVVLSHPSILPPESADLVLVSAVSVFSFPWVPLIGFLSGGRRVGW